MKINREIDEAIALQKEIDEQQEKVQQARYKYEDEKLRLSLLYKRQSDLY